MTLSKVSTDDLLNELNKRNPWLSRIQLAPYIDVEPETLAARDSRKSHDLKRYKFGKNGRVKYRWLDIQEYLSRQLMPD